MKRSGNGTLFTVCAANLPVVLFGVVLQVLVQKSPLLKVTQLHPPQEEIVLVHTHNSFLSYRSQPLILRPSSSALL